MERAVLFDCDGVLLDSEGGLSIIAAEFLHDKLGIPAKPEDFLPFIGTGEDSYVGGVVNKYGLAYTLDMKQGVYEEYIRNAHLYIEAFAGAKEFLAKLRREGYKVALASSADKIKVDVNLKILNMTDLDFDVVITGSDVARKKPNPDIYLLAAARCGIKPENCIVVEDAVSGVLSGKNAEMKVIGFTSSLPASVLRENGADYTVSNYKELDEVIHEIG
ncbi:MAG: HAD family hydrolase [Saccharofermentanales bacterium]